MRDNAAPHSLPFRPETIPTGLKALPCWVGWNYKREGDKWKKPPVSLNGRPQSELHTPDFGVSFERAWAAYKGGELAGLGLDLIPDCGVVCVDIDHCLSDAGTICGNGSQTPAGIADIIKRAATYVEISPGGDGLHIWLRGRFPRGKRGNGLELYGGGQYVTVTGQLMNDDGPRELAEGQGLIAHIEKAMPPSPGSGYAPKARARSNAFYTGGTWKPLSDDELIDLACEKNSNFARLWSGDAGDYGGDYSSGDEALMLHLLHWCDDDGERAVSLFGQSALAARENGVKWKRADYRELTLAKAQGRRNGTC